MKKTAKRANAAKQRGLLLILALIVLTAPHGPAIAQTTDADEPVLTLSLNDLGEASIVGPIEPPSVQDTLLTVCQARGYGEDCAKVLLGMAWKESNFIGTAIGDRGHARGWFQIWPKHHSRTLQGVIDSRHPHIKSPIDCAEDLACSADWTLDYLERNHYPKYVKYAVQCHNGCNIANGYAASAMRHGNRLWEDEATEVALAE